jgi:transposase
VKTDRAHWKSVQSKLPVNRLVFIDETSANTQMTRSHGRCPQGQRLVMSKPHGHWKTTTFIGALTVRGLQAPAVIDGTMNGDRFLDYVTNILIPTLQSGDILVMDNLPVHKRVAVREALDAQGITVLFLPPYSPDLNPIEKAFSKLKSLLRKVQKRTVPELQEYLRTALDGLLSTECQNYFRSCGYKCNISDRESL